VHEPEIGIIIMVFCGLQAEEIAGVAGISRVCSK